MTPLHPTPAFAHLSVPPRSTASSTLAMLARQRDDLLGEWRRLLGADSAALEKVERGSDPMSHVVDAVLADLARTDGERMIAPESVFAAAVHGTVRRMQTVRLEVVLREFDVLRMAVNAVLGRLSSAPAHRELTGRLDFVLTTASLASLRGYHRDEFDALGQWPSILDDLLLAENPWAEARAPRAAAS